MPRAVIDRAYPDPNDRRSMCAANARALFDSEVVRELPFARLTIIDNTGPEPVTETYERRSGALQARRRPEQLSCDTDAPCFSSAARGPVAARCIHAQR